MKYVASRILSAVIVIVLVTFFTFWMLDLVPGDICTNALGVGANDETIADCRADLKLDDNIFVRYGSWAGDMLTGDFGQTYVDRQPVTEALKNRMPITLSLFIYSQVVAFALAVPLGTLAAYKAGEPARSGVMQLVALAGSAALFGLLLATGTSAFAALLVAAIAAFILMGVLRGGRWLDKLISGQAFAFLSIPVFVLAETLRYFFAVEHGWYDLTGYVGITENLVDHLRSVWLPVVVLGLVTSPVYLRLLRTDMVTNLQEDFVAVAKAKGLPDRTILARHVLRPSTLTLITVAGLNIAQLVNGAIVIEFIYDLDGVGSYLLDSVSRGEFLAVQTLVALVAVLFVVVNTIIDLVYGLIDPRVKVERRSS